jgi:FtsH-binding integral membrane protein
VNPFKLKVRSIPFIFLVLASCFWAYFYQSSIWLNEYGSYKPEWLLIIDGLLVLPILCLVCIENKKEAINKAIVYGCLIVLLGSLIIPESSKLYWNYLESLRYLALAAFLLLEVVTIFTVIFAIKASLDKSQDPDLSISEPIESIVGKSAISQLLCFEARVWTYLLFSSRISKNNFEGNSHYYGYKKDGTKSNLMGFIMLIAFELPIMHLILHFVWSPIAANIISALTLIGLVFFISEYKAISIRPISITGESLTIRYGLWNPVKIRHSEIKSVILNYIFVRRASDVKRFNLSGVPNIKIELLSGNKIYLGLDSPRDFIEDLSRYKKNEF